MRNVRAGLIPLGFALLAACTEQPAAPVLSSPQFDVAPGSEISNVTGSVQGFSSLPSFTAATGAVVRIDPNLVPTTWSGSWYWANPYQLNGMKVDYFPYDRWRLGLALYDKTPLLPGREFTFNGPDDFSITTDDLVNAVGIWVVDNTTQALSGTGYPGVDTRWLVRLYDAEGVQVGSLQVDPPVNRAFFLGISSSSLFKKAVFTELNPDPLGENDFWGAIYATPRNVNPVVTLSGNTSILIGETYSGVVAITDPDGASWKANVAFGDAYTQALETAEHIFNVAHLYSETGDYNVSVTVTDERTGQGTAATTVHVLSPEQGAAVLEETINEILLSDEIAPQDAKPLLESVSSALTALASGNTTAALGKLGAFDNKVKALGNSRRIDAATQKLLLDYSARLQQSIHKK